MASLDRCATAIHSDPVAALAAATAFGFIATELLDSVLRVGAAGVWRWSCWAVDVAERGFCPQP